VGQADRRGYRRRLVPFCGSNPTLARKDRRAARENKIQREVGTNVRGVMITATWTWTDIRNFEEDPSGCQRAQLAWTLVLAAALEFS
jgi:hypothetical protein